MSIVKDKGTSPEPGSRPSENNCVEQWKNDLKVTTNLLKTKEAQKQKSFVAKTNAQLWENKLKGYWDAVDATYKLTVEISSVLELFKSKASTVCVNVSCIREASEILYCHVKRISICLDNLNVLLSNIQMAIKCLSEPNLNTKSSKVMKCLTNLADKIDAAIVLQKEVLKKAIYTLKCAHWLEKMVCEDTDGCISEEQSIKFDCGLKANLQYLCDMFKTKNGIVEMPECPPLTASCDAEITPVADFPFNTHPYVVLTFAQLAKSKGETTEETIAYDAIRKECEEIKTCKTSLDKAVAAAEAAKECK